MPRCACVISLLVAAAAAVPARCEPHARAAPQTQPAAAPLPQQIGDAIARGTAFLLGSQNADGSWGSARRTKGLNIYAPVPGAHHAFRTAVTSLCVSALIEAPGPDPNVARSIDRGEACLIANLPKVRRAVPRAIYNNWTHAYGIRALVRMHARRPGDEARRKKIRGLIAGQVGLLKRFQTINGGWGYLGFRYKTKQPSGTSMCFTTATVLIALHEAASLGVHVPREMVDRGLDSVRLQQNPDFSYLYSDVFKFYRGRLICRPGGSLGRSQACNLALRLWGDKRITDAVLAEWLDRLLKRNGWLSRARKMPVPHESWFHVSGYFYYYGHYYAAGCIEQLPAARRPAFQARLARILIGLQEKDGSWWDYPMYDYHQGWGTAYALMTLSRCRPAAAK